MMELAQAIMADDARRVAEIIQDWDEIDHLLQFDGGVEATLLFGAIYFGAPEVTALLLSRGANPDLGAGDHSARACAIIPRSRCCLKVIFAAGYKPTGEELLAYFINDFEPDIPVTPEERSYRRFVQTTKQSDLASFALVLEKVSSDDDLAAYVPYRNVLVALREELKRTPATQPRRVFALRKQIDDHENIRRPALLVQVKIISYSVILLTHHAETLNDVVLRYFVPFRNHTGFLLKSLSAATDAVASLVADNFNLPEDDSVLLKACRLALTGYPVRAVGQGSLEQGSARERRTGIPFERASADILIAAGFKVKEVGRTGDQGADIIASKDGLTYAIQCKDLQSPVGNSAVQEVVAARRYYTTDFAVVCAVSGFTKSAKELAARSDTVLVTPTSLANIGALARAMG